MLATSLHDDPLMTVKNVTSGQLIARLPANDSLVGRFARARGDEIASGACRVGRYRLSKWRS